MGYGDIYHEHPIRRLQKKATKKGSNCVRCELPITSRWYYGCVPCGYFLHGMCLDLPGAIWHPVHEPHHLTLLTPRTNTSRSDNHTTSLCNECHSPCLGDFTYECSTCQFTLHLKCCFTLKHGKHKHLLSFIELCPYDEESPIDRHCSICGHRADGLTFACPDCNDICIHRQCTLLPPVIKHHHVHELTLNHDFPKECEQVYCDLCEDRDGKELDRSLSYYYCKKCDYIAHVRCVTQPNELETVQLNHKHPSKPVSGTSANSFFVCDAWKILTGSSYFCNNQCYYIIHKSFAEFPSLIKHPHHQEHALTFSYSSSSEKGVTGSSLQCTDCEFTIGPVNGLIFNHPNHSHELWFSSRNGVFWCDACGEFGEGFRMECIWKNDGCNFDLHLECFALPGKFQLESHAHSHKSLYLVSQPASSTSSRNCNVCRNEIDLELWSYCCQECNYVAHLKCVVSDLLVTLRSTIKNQPDFCAIIQSEESSFKPQAEQLANICKFISRDRNKPLSSPWPLYFNHLMPLFFVSEVQHRENEFGRIAGLRIKEGSDKSDSITSSHKLPSLKAASTLLNANSVDALHCPKCKLLIDNRASSCINEWLHNHGKNFEENSIIRINDQTRTHSDPLALLDEQLIDELYCPICSLLIFPPTYSCASCQIYFHKSCAELLFKYLSFGGHTFSLVAPPFRNGLSDCTHCKNPITGYAYLCPTCEITLDVHCALGAPMMKNVNHKHRLFCWHSKKSDDDITCRACGGYIDDGTVYFRCEDIACRFYLHVECALLPPIIKHRIHQHPLELAADLDDLDDEYICDACEKDLNGLLWAYRCVDSCKGYATSHVTCVITSKKTCHFKYDEECRVMSEVERARARGIRGMRRQRIMPLQGKQLLMTKMKIEEEGL